ncbi:MAG TPA: OB-fold domain-containing protein [Candidatus Limnocylindria bacterium]|nr:OB-fold domain-containing protein [Candidatus Limnocylindria bacterium]
MTDYGDALTGPFWEGAVLGELRLPFCSRCGRAEWYPRPFCLACGGEPRWRRASGRGLVHSLTVVRVPVLPDLEPPYVVGLIDLDEGPRFLAAVEARPGEVAIGDRVVVAWRSRVGLPPLAAFRPLSPSGTPSR